MISIVMPTMMRVDKDIIYYSIKHAIDSEVVDRITVIDNSTGGFSKTILIKSNKLIVRTMEKNICVNPAWNIGVSLSTSENVLIMNDDILCHKEVYRQVNEVMGYENMGLCSVQTNNSRSIQSYLKNIDDFDTKISIEDTFDKSQLNNKTGWFFCVKKKLWKDIPKKLLFFYGDDLIYDRMRNMKYLTKNISSCKVGHIGSHTVNKNKNIKDIIVKEHQIYKRVKSDYIR